MLIILLNNIESKYNICVYNLIYNITFVSTSHLRCNNID